MSTMFHFRKIKYNVLGESAQLQLQICTVVPTATAVSLQQRTLEPIPYI